MDSYVNYQRLIPHLKTLPKNVLGRAVGAVAHTDLPQALTRPCIRLFAKYFAIEIDEAELPLSAYRNLGQFFGRRLKTGARIIDRRPGLAVAPIDGRVVSYGRLSAEIRIQVKEEAYSLSDLLGDATDLNAFSGGHWLTIELDTRDSHRVHHPVEGRMTHSLYAQSELLRLPWRARRHDGALGALGERLVTFVDSPLGAVATIMLGRVAGGRVALLQNAQDHRMARIKPGVSHYASAQRVARGDELGYTDLGSTVVVLFGCKDLCMEPFAPNVRVEVGQVVARHAKGPLTR